MTMTYWQQLKHPSWQKLRLQILDRDGFMCRICGGAESTLHVHHKQYIKGRMAWEYDADNFESLCDSCHEEAHATSDAIKHVIAAASVLCHQEIADVILGYSKEQWNCQVAIESQNPYDEMIGRLASQIASSFSIGDIEALSQKLEEHRFSNAGFTFKVSPKRKFTGSDDF